MVVHAPCRGADTWLVRVTTKTAPIRGPHAMRAIILGNQVVPHDGNANQDYLTEPEGNSGSTKPGTTSGNSERSCPTQLGLHSVETFLGIATCARGRTTKHRSSRSLRAVRAAGIETASCWDKHRPRGPETLHMLGKHKPAETPPWGLGRLLKTARQVSTTTSDRTRTDEDVVHALCLRIDVLLTRDRCSGGVPSDVNGFGRTKGR